MLPNTVTFRKKIYRVLAESNRGYYLLLDSIFTTTLFQNARKNVKYVLKDKVSLT